MWTGARTAWRIVPRHVKWRVLRIVVTLLVGLAAGVACIGRVLPAPWATAGSTALLGGVLLTGLYAGWCLWPRVRVGIRDDLRMDLPCPANQPVRLSFDDGPTPGLTDAVLDLLHQHRVQATFFVLTHKARCCPGLLRRIVAEGHTLGLHGEDHRVALFRSADALQASLQRARDELATLSGQPITLYRPSHGWKNRALLRALRRVGLRLVFWDYGVWDTDNPPVAALLQRLRWATAAQQENHPAPMILLHDGRDDVCAVPAHAPALLAALSEWLPSLAQRVETGSAEPNV